MDIHFPTLNIKLSLQHIWKIIAWLCGHRFSNVEYRILYVSRVATSVQIFLTEIWKHIHFTGDNWNNDFSAILTYEILYISCMKILIKIFWHEYVIFCISHHRNQGTDFPTWIRTSLCFTWASLVAQRIKHLPAMQETWVWTLGREDPLEKGMATHSSILAWRIPWMEDPGRLQSMGS